MKDHGIDTGKYAYTSITGVVRGLKGRDRGLYFKVEGSGMSPVSAKMAGCA